MSERIKTIAIAAGGKGTRMRELSEEQPKHIVPVLEKPFLGYGIANAIQAGFTRIVLLVEYKAQMLQEAIMKLECVTSSNVQVDFVRQSEKVGDKYGTAAVVEALESALQGEPFVSFNGDGLFTVEALQEAAVNDGFHHVFTQQNENTSPEAVVVMDSKGMMQRIGVEEGSDAPLLMNTALYTFQPEIFKYAKSVKESPRGEYEVTEAINTLCAEDRVKAHVLQQQWVELTAPEDIAQVETFIRTNGYA